jgi:hypothetical protein
MHSWNELFFSVGHEQLMILWNPKMDHASNHKYRSMNARAELNCILSCIKMISLSIIDARNVHPFGMHCSVLKQPCEPCWHRLSM